MSNTAHHRGDVPPCHFSGAVRAEETGPDFGAGLRRLVFQPLSLASGESLAIDLPPTVADIAAMPATDRVLVITLEDHRARPGTCPLLVQAFGYDPATRATKQLVDNLDIFIVPTVNPDASRGVGFEHPRPLGFVGGSAAQAARLVLFSDTTGPGSSLHCAQPGVVSVLVIPRLDDDVPAPPMASTRGWPVTWEGPGLESVAVVEVPFNELATRADERVDALLSLQFDGILPAVCRRGISAVLEIFDRASGETQARIPLSRPWFGRERFPY